MDKLLKWIIKELEPYGNKKYNSSQYDTVEASEESRKDTLEEVKGMIELIKKEG